MRSNAEDSKPYASSFVSVGEWLRESNALLISVDKIHTNSFLSIASFQSSVRRLTAMSLSVSSASARKDAVEFHSHLFTEQLLKHLEGRYRSVVLDLLS